MNKKLLLKVNNLECGYGDVNVIRGISLYLNDNEGIGLFGPNGHGKSTFLRTVSGLIKPWKGSITFNNEVIDGLTPCDIVNKGIIHVPQGNQLFPRMTVLDNLFLGAYCKRVWLKRKKMLNYVFNIFPILFERKNQLCRTLSGGERQMLAIGTGLMGEAKLLMLDEPSFGLAPKIKKELRDSIKLIRNSGIPLIIVDQDVELLSYLVDRLYLIEDGKIVYESIDGKVESKEVFDKYFGRSLSLN